MQAVILAAGKSTRTYPLTLTRPKPLLKVANKAILEYNLEAIQDIADEIILVVGYKKDMIKDFISKNFPKLNVNFVEQKEQLGTGHAVQILEPYIKDKFILMLGDNVYSKQDVKEISNHKYSILVKKVKNPENFGVVTEKNGIISDIIEKPQKFVSDLVSCGLFSFDKKLFTLLKSLNKSERDELELTDAIKDLSKQDSIHCVKSKFCFQISYPWDLLIADKEIRKMENLIGKSSKINGIIFNSSIGKNCIINGNIKNSIIMDNTTIEDKSIIEDSIIGENANFSGKIISEKNVYSMVKNEKIKVDRLGAIIADNVKAEDVEINPGCKIWPNKKISGKITKDII